MNQTYAHFLTVALAVFAFKLTSVNLSQDQAGFGAVALGALSTSQEAKVIKRTTQTNNTNFIILFYC